VSESYKHTFDELMIDETKNARKIKKEDYLINGLYPIVDQSKNEISGYCNDQDGIYNDIPAIIFGDHTRIIKYVDTPFFLGADGVKLLRSKDNNINYKYLFYFYKYNEVPNTGYNRHFKWLKEIPIYLPYLNLQNQIAIILDRITELINLRKQRLVELDNLIKSRFVEMFGDPAMNDRGWECGTIRDIVSEVKYGTSKPANEGGQYPYLRMNNITYDGQLDLSDLKYIDVPDSEIEKYIARKGDILFNRTNSKELVGKTCVFDIDEQMVIAGYIIRVRLNNKAIPIYLSTVLNSDYGKTTLKAMCKAIIGQANINAQELQDIKIQIPPIELQHRFAEFVCANDKSKFYTQKSIEESQQLFDSLMSRYFD